MAGCADTTATPGLTNGLETYTISHSSGATALVYCHGATVADYTSASGQKVLFVSAESAFDGVKPIRGGIPLVFPKFGDGWHGTSSPSALPSHGFARRSRWSLAVTPDGRIGFELDQAALDAEYRASWPYDFKLRLAIELRAEGFATTLTVHNSGTAPFDFQALLHTYYRMSNVEDISVSGLVGKSYIDKLLPVADQQAIETNEVVNIAAETDRIYKDAAGALTLTGLDGTRHVAKIVIEATDAASDCVVWNPWVAKSAKMADFGDDEYKKMVCVEPGFVAEPTTLKPGGDWFLRQEISLEVP